MMSWLNNFKKEKEKKMLLNIWFLLSFEIIFRLNRVFLDVRHVSKDVNIFRRMCI